jgi:hydroxymethylglutaryl-CoA reductase (NADPH)
VATYGGGTGLPTPARVPGAARLLLARARCTSCAEIVAATVLCGELSLGSAIVAEEWVEAHDLLGRNRP